jgi:hypothetical protein
LTGPGLQPLLLWLPAASTLRLPPESDAFTLAKRPVTDRIKGFQVGVHQTGSLESLLNHLGLSALILQSQDRDIGLSFQKDLVDYRDCLRFIFRAEIMGQIDVRPGMMRPRGVRTVNDGNRNFAVGFQSPDRFSERLYFSSFAPVILSPWLCLSKAEGLS